ncbi:Ppx/GppA family phosphatase [Sphingomonas sabuli]|uniref:Ppx/GppA family phosphatase n=1 Tax=Sphingomonas sabuli TaxID=2764186 RepID=A0A7G9L1C8_9SPHN|nr:Ppx/GppA family phosphatase [Sphingomonas sabuli]QNM82427.1 Ppx/GppA family phosphatase [Sphingomonas sabuli]
MSHKPVAIIDIGSNTVRLVVYSGDQRVPIPLFNEKTFAGLGESLSDTGRISDSAARKALKALRRFKLIVKQFGAGRTSVIATAAVRDASNGAEFAREIKALGLPLKMLEPEEEARLAGLGVISAIPWADGIVGDLGGGSLELVEVAGGCTGHGLSLPLGVLRVDTDRRTARRMLEEAIDAASLDCAGDRDLYLVGGSWRALARIDALINQHPLPILHNYRMLAARAAELQKLVANPDPQWSGKIASSRLAAAPAAAFLLSILVERLTPRWLIVSTYGIREGLLFSRLSRTEQRRDPLVAAAQALSEAEGFGDGHGASLDRWMAGCFDDPPKLARLRLAACFIADVAWRANPLFRAEQAVEVALHANWVGIDIAGRVLIAEALSCAFDNDDLADTKLLQLCKPGDVQRARAWGLAIRAGQRLSGGVAAILDQSKLVATEDAVELHLARADADLVNEGVLKRLKRLAAAVDREAAVVPR